MAHYIDQWTKCSCGHTFSMHSVIRPCACRSNVCECEGFYKLMEDGVVITVPATREGE